MLDKYLTKPGFGAAVRRERGFLIFILLIKRIHFYIN